MRGSPSTWRLNDFAADGHLRGLGNRPVEDAGGIISSGYVSLKAELRRPRAEGRFLGEDLDLFLVYGYAKCVKRKRRHVNETDT